MMEYNYIPKTNFSDVHGHVDAARSNTNEPTEHKHS